jgi:hypothetical protein
MVSLHFPHHCGWVVYGAVGSPQFVSTMGGLAWRPTLLENNTGEAKGVP